MSMRRWIRRIWIVVGSLGLRFRIGTGVLVLAVLAGALWLALRSGTSVEWSALDEVDRADLPAAIERLQANRILAQIEGTRLCVDRRDLGRARAVLAYEGLTGQNLVSVFEQLARESDIWSTADLNDKRWQAAKMTTLSRLIGMFPPVRTATVLYETGSQRRIGSEGNEATASVKVSLKPDAVMDRKLVQAIADLVSGSIAGMKRQNVHIVDNSGKSYRLPEDGASDGLDRMEQVRLAEDMARQRILQALAYVKAPTVAVRFEAQGPENKCVAASVSLPHSYIRGLFPAGTATDDPESDGGCAVDAELFAVRQVVQMLTGMTDGSAVQVGIYEDGPAPAPPAAPVAAAIPWKVHQGVYSASLAFAGLVCGVLAYRRRRRRKRRESAGASAPEEDSHEAQNVWTGASMEAFGFLEGVEPSQLLECLRSEHPQTVALVLAQIDPDKSAAVLGGLSPAQQVEVSRRIAAMERIDADVTAQLAATLRQRLGTAEPAGTSASGMSIITRILRQAPPAVEQSVLSALSMEEPTLAQTIRRRMLAFEDLQHLPSYRLRAALDGFDSEELAVAMRTAGKQLKVKILEGLSSPSAQRLREELERMGPVRLSDVEMAQQHVTEAVRRSDSGTYVPSGAVKERLA